MADLNNMTELMAELERKKNEVDYSAKLPDSELEIMLAVWDLEPPVTTAALMEAVGKRRGWKAPTLISFLGRLETRGFLVSCKNGRERYYLPAADRERYISGVTGRFVQTCHGGSLVKLLDSLYFEREFRDSDIDELLVWLKNRG